MNPELLLLILRVFLALVLYCFLGLAILIVWRSIPGKMIGEELPLAYANEYTEEGLVRSHSLGAINLIGRAADNTIVLVDEGVSAHHARLSFSGGQWMLEDLGSRNGTYVNEIQLEEPLVIALEDEIQVGAVHLRIEVDAPEPDDTRSAPLPS